MKAPLVTWTEQGVPFAETRARMPERADAECYSTYVFFTLQGLLTPQWTCKFGNLAVLLQSTKAILNVVEPALRSSLAKRIGDLSPMALDALIEMYGLTIEVFVRQAKKISVKPNDARVSTQS